MDICSGVPVPGVARNTLVLPSSFYINACVKKGKFTFLLRLVSELNARIQAVDVLFESFDIILVDLYEGVVDIPEPHTRWIGSGGHS